MSKITIPELLTCHECEQRLPSTAYIKAIKNGIMTTGKWGSIHAREIDAQVLLEVFVDRQYRHLDLESARVLDVGAHIGTFSLYALLHGAHSVTAYEPEPDNFKVLRRNARGRPTLDTVNQAVVGTSSGEVTIYGTGSLASTNERVTSQVTVSCVSFEEALWVNRPTLVKMDIEGSEYDCFSHVNESDLSTVTQIGLELHFKYLDQLSQAKALDRKLRSFGFTPQRKLITPKKVTGWGKMMFYSRI